MKFLLLGVSILLCAGAVAESVKFPLEVGTLKTRDGKVLEDAKILGKDAVGVRVMHAGGTARISFDRLPKDLAARFPKDRAAAKEQLAKEARKEVAHDRAVDRSLQKRAMKEVGKEDDDEDWESGGIPVDKGSIQEKIASLEAYVFRLDLGIKRARATVEDAERRAQRYRNTATTYVNRSDGNGGVSQYSVVNKTRLTRANFQQGRADREKEKIERARALIADAQEKLNTLRQGL